MCTNSSMQTLTNSTRQVGITREAAAIPNLELPTRVAAGRAARMIPGALGILHASKDAARRCSASFPDMLLRLAGLTGVIERRCRPRQKENALPIFKNGTSSALGSSIQLALKPAFPHTCILYIQAAVAVAAMGELYLKCFTYSKHAHSEHHAGQKQTCVHVLTYYRPTAAGISLSIATASDPRVRSDPAGGYAPHPTPVTQTRVCYRVSIPTPTGRRRLGRFRGIPPRRSSSTQQEHTYLT